jgi:hypothetical protein
MTIECGRRAACRWATVVLLCGVIQLASPRSAHAWFEWLDNLSGPGDFHSPYWSGHFDVPVICFAEPPRWPEAIGVTRRAYSTLSLRTVGIESQVEALRKLVELQDGFSTKEPSAEQMKKMASGIEDVLEKIDPKAYSDAFKALTKAASFWRGATQPRTAYFPGWFVDANCGDPHKAVGKPLTYTERRPRSAVYVSYAVYGLNTPNSLDNAKFENNGSQIYLNVLEPKYSWPMSGGLDILDGQAGAGVFWMTSEGIISKKVGWIIEPLRLNLHFSSEFARRRGRWHQIVSAGSLTAGFLIFPTAFEEGEFIPNSPKIAAREAVPHFGYDIDVGRLATAVFGH